MITEASIAAAVFAAVLVAAAAAYATRPSFPGKLKATGTFESRVDLSDAGTRTERERDFARICDSQLYLQFTDGVARPRLVELNKADFDGYMAQMQRHFGAESKILADYGYALISATTPFEFATQFGVPPNFGDTRYVIIHGQGTLRVMWAALLNDTPTKDGWPYVVCFVSEPLTPRPRVVTRMTYFCARHTSPSLGADIDAWFKTKFPRL